LPERAAGSPEPELVRASEFGFPSDFGLRISDLGNCGPERARTVRAWRAPRTSAVILGVIIVACGCFGLASRASHFRNTWCCGQILNRDVLAHLKTAPPGRGVVRFIWAERCQGGYCHSTYLVNPTIIFPLDLNFPWLKARFPGIEMQELRSLPAGPGQPGDLILDGHDLPPQPAW